MAKLIEKRFMYELWRFENEQEAYDHAKKEAIVCGDEITAVFDHALEIYNYHSGTVRWRGEF